MALGSWRIWNNFAEQMVENLHIYKSESTFRQTHANNSKKMTREKSSIDWLWNELWIDSWSAMSFKLNGIKPIFLC